MKNVVITGSTRGIGYGLAVEFLRAGCKVTINGRSQESVDRAVADLKQYSSSVTSFAATTVQLKCLKTKKMMLKSNGLRNQK